MTKQDFSVSIKRHLAVLPSVPGMQEGVLLTEGGGGGGGGGGVVSVAVPLVEFIYLLYPTRLLSDSHRRCFRSL